MLSKDKKISLRLEEVRGALKLAKGEIAERLGVYAQDYSKFFPATDDGESKRKPETLVVELLSLGVNAHWYLTGQGKMFAHEVREKNHQDTENEDVLRQEAQKIQLLFDRGLINVERGAKKLENSKPKPPATVKIIAIPFYTHTVAAGLPADSSGSVEEYLDLPRHMVNHPGDTYAVRACGDSMIGANIEEDDLLIVDKALEPQNNSIVIASINGEQTVKRLLIQGEAIYLAPENHKYPITEITEEMDFRTLGVVTWVIRRTG